MDKRIVPQHLMLNEAEAIRYEHFYALGYAHAAGLASCNVPKVGDSIDRSVDYWGIGPVVTEDNAKEYHEMLCYAAEQHGREYSPFEFTAKEINEDEVLGPDYGWDAFDSGVAARIGKDLDLYYNEDYK